MKKQGEELDKLNKKYDEHIEKMKALGKTDEERSLVCPTGEVPSNTIRREDGWRAFRIQGVLDFSLVGILSEIAAVLANIGLSIFAISTYNTDYVLVKGKNYTQALDALASSGYTIVD